MFPYDEFTEPFCIVEADTNDLVKQMIDYMSKVRDKCYLLAKEKFAVETL